MQTAVAFPFTAEPGTPVRAARRLTFAIYGITIEPGTRGIITDTNAREQWAMCSFDGRDGFAFPLIHTDDVEAIQ